MASLRLVNGTLKCPRREDPHPYQDPLSGILEALLERPLPAVDHRAQHDDCMGDAHNRRRVGVGMGSLVGRKTTPRNASGARRRRPTERVGTTQPAAAYGCPRGRPRAPMGRAHHGVDAGNPRAPLGVAGGHILPPPLAAPPQLVLRAANMVQGTKVGVWGKDAPTIRCPPPPGEESAWLTIAHYETLL